MNNNHLIEARLRKYIYESVKEIIQEMDWRTLTNAANKALDRGETIRADRFADYANHTLANAERTKGNMDDKTYKSVGYKVSAVPNDRYNNSQDISPYVYRGYAYGDNGKDNMNSYLDSPQDIGYKSVSNFFDGDNGMTKMYNKYKRQTDNFKNGKSKYIKGKGWIEDADEFGKETKEENPINNHQEPSTQNVVTQQNQTSKNKAVQSITNKIMRNIKQKFKK